MSLLSQDQTSGVASRYQDSLADRMWKRNRLSASSETENPDSTDQDSASEDRPEIYQRVDHVLDGLQSLLPNQMSSSVSILTEIMRGMRRDISLVPEEDVQQFMRSIGEACAWIADGSMADLYEESEDAGI